METSAARKTNAPDFATAYYFLEGLTELGVEYLFCNFGTDHAPIIEEMAHRKKRGEAMPGVLHCPHENTAAHMAEGYAFVTGRGQGVLVHVDVGTANTANAMHNAYRSRLPVLLMAGKAPYTANDELVGSRDTYVHFVQEPFDQASLVRPYLKWEWTLPSGVVVKEALRRAYSIMQSEPRGPVYLMMQRETLTQHWSTDEIRRYSADQFAATSGGGADPKLVAALADQLLDGREPGADHRLCGPQRARLGGDRCAGAIRRHRRLRSQHDQQHLARHRRALSVSRPTRRCPTPTWEFWSTSMCRGSRATCRPAKNRSGRISISTRSSPARRCGRSPATCACRATRAASSNRCSKTSKPRQRRASRKRPRSGWSTSRPLREERIARAAKLAADKGKPGAINPHYLMAELGKVLDDDAIIFNEGVTNAGAVLMQIPRKRPNTTMRSGGGGLGWSGGMALGAKLAAPDRLMVQISGDGGFYFGNPSSVFAVSQQYKLPFFSIVMDNTGWNAVKQSTLRVYPEGEAKGTGEFESKLAPQVHFTKVAEAFGAYGEEVSDPADVPAAIARCLKEVRPAALRCCTRG